MIKSKDVIGLLFLLLGNEKTNNILRLDHVVLIDLELPEDVINFSRAELVSPGHKSVLEHTGVNLAFKFISLEGLDDEIIGIVAISGHLGLEHLDHVVEGASSSNLAQHIVKLILLHELTNIVEGSSQVVFVEGSVLVDVHELEALLVHEDLVLGEAAFILSLAHVACVLSSV